MPDRRRAREFAVQILYQIDVSGQGLEEALSLFHGERRIAPPTWLMTERLVRGARERLAEVDAAITGASQNWRLDRMPVVDRSVLRLAVFELLYEAETPAVAVINEAVDLAKQFGGEESGPFVNGLLDAVRKRAAGPPETGRLY